MILPGHIAGAYLAGEALRVDRRGYGAAAMFPDLIDKPIRWILALTPNDRIPAHSLTMGLLTAVIVRWLGGAALARGWCVGYGAHLLCDEVNAQMNAGRVYWLWPWRHYEMHRGPTGLKSSLQDFGPQSLVAEAALTALGVFCWWRRRRSRRAAKG